MPQPCCCSLLLSPLQPMTTCLCPACLRPVLLYCPCSRLDPNLNSELTFRDAMRLAVQSQLAAYRTASAVTSANGRPVFKCDDCGRRVQHSDKLRLVHVEPSFGQVGGGWMGGWVLEQAGAGL